VTGKINKYIIELRVDWCKGCYFCLKVCPVEGIFSQSGEIGSKGFKPVEVHPPGCTGCLLCELLCPDLAITVSEYPDNKNKVSGKGEK
jgi:2-oxoglutarate ferredoxin oxidoreductase subunit delta